MERIEEFTRKGKNFIYFDLSGLQRSEDYTQLIEEAKLAIAKYSEFPVYTIININHIRFDTNVKEILVKWLEYNKPYVDYGVIVGTNGIRKIMFNSIMSAAGRMNFVCLPKKEAAIDWLLQHGAVG